MATTRKKTTEETETQEEETLVQDEPPTQGEVDYATFHAPVGPPHLLVGMERWKRNVEDQLAQRKARGEKVMHCRVCGIVTECPRGMVLGSPCLQDRSCS